MSAGHPQATALYGAPKLMWRPVAPPEQHVFWRRDSRCGLYRIEHLVGVKKAVFVAIYLSTPTLLDSVAIERTEAAALDWVQRHHERRCRALAEGRAA